MSSVELQQLLSDMKEHFQDFKSTLQDLRNPSEEFVTNFYSYWVQEFEVDIKDIFQTQFPQTAVVSVYQDTYSGMIPKVNLLNSIRAFDVVPDFGILDIVSPTPKRIQTILRAFINFYVWADNRANGILDKTKVLNERKSKLSKITKEREELKENLNAVIRNFVQIKDSKTQLEKELVYLKQKSTDLMLEKTVLRTKIDELNEMLKEKENLLQKINKEDSSVSNKIKDFSSLIVDSPSSVLAELQSLRSRNEEMIEISKQKQNMVEFKMLAHKNLLKVIEDQQQRLVQLNDILNQINEHRELLQIVSGYEKNTNLIQDHLNELKLSLISQKDKKQNRQEALQSLYLKWKTLKPQLSESVEAALRELNDKKNEKNKMTSHLKEYAFAKDYIESIFKKIKSFTEHFLADYENAEVQESEFIKQYKSDLLNHMDDVTKGF